MQRSLCCLTITFQKRPMDAVFRAAGLILECRIGGVQDLGACVAALAFVYLGGGY